MSLGLQNANLTSVQPVDTLFMTWEVFLFDQCFNPSEVQGKTQPLSHVVDI